MTERLLCEQIATERFRMPRSELMRRMIRELPLAPWIVLAVLFLGCIVLGAIVNIRFVAVGLMLLFIVAPAISAYLYFSYGLRKYVAFNVLSHQLRFTPEGVTVTIFVPMGNIEEEKRTDNETDDAKEEEEKLEETREMFIRRDMLGKGEMTVKALYIQVIDTDSGFIYIPLEQLPE